MVSPNIVKFYGESQHCKILPAVIPNKPEASLHHKILWRVPKYKILHDKTPNYLKKLCIPSSEVHTRNLRKRIGFDDLTDWLLYL
jgi:hypothetical protein